MEQQQHEIENAPVLSKRAKGCLWFFVGFLVFVFSLAILSPSKPKDKRQASGFQNPFEERGYNVAKETLHPEDEPFVSLMPQADGGDRIKIEYRIRQNEFLKNPRKGREGILSDIREFMKKFYQEGNAHGIAYFWFSPQATFVNEYGKESVHPVGKFILPRETADKVANWNNLDVGQIEFLFSSQGTFEWNAANPD